MFSADAIIQTIGNVVGGTAGAFLGGYFAVKVMKKQKEFQLEQIKEEREENFEKTFWLLRTAFQGVGDAIIKLHDTLNNPAITNANYAYLAGLLAGAMESAKDDINMVNDDFIPKEIYPKYLVGRKLLSMCELTIKRYNDDFFNKEDKEFLIEKDSDEFQALYKNGVELKSLIGEISEYKTLKK